MKRFLLLITLFAAHSVQSMQRPNLNIKEIGTPMPRIAGFATTASLIHSIWTIIRLIRAYNQPKPVLQIAQPDEQPKTVQTQDTATQTDIAFSAIEEQLEKQTKLLLAQTQQLAQLQTQPSTADTEAVAAAPVATADDVATLMQEIGHLKTQLEQHNAADVAETTSVDNAQLLEQLQQQRVALATQASELQQLTAALKAAKPRKGCSPWWAASLPVIYLALQQIVPLLITPVFPS